MAQVHQFFCIDGQRIKLKTHFKEVKNSVEIYFSYNPSIYHSLTNLLFSCIIPGVLARFFQFAPVTTHSLFFLL